MILVVLAFFGWRINVAYNNVMAACDRVNALADTVQTSLDTLDQSQLDDMMQDLPEITERAYLQALEKILENAADYYTTEEISLALNYTDGRWQLIMNTSLLKALNGGAGY